MRNGVAVKPAQLSPMRTGHLAKNGERGAFPGTGQRTRLTGETFLVKSIYANVTYRECLDLWNCGGSVAANKRTPDPVYEGTIEETPVDTLIDIRRAAQTDSIDRIEAIDESTPDSLAF